MDLAHPGCQVRLYNSEFHGKLYSGLSVRYLVDIHALAGSTPCNLGKLSLSPNSII